MDQKKVRLDNRCLGKEAFLVGVRPSYAYMSDGQRGGIVGHIYEICLPEHGFDKLAVKIEGEPQIELPDGEHMPVTLADLVVRPYVGRDGRLAYSATASGIKAVQPKG